MRGEIIELRDLRDYIDRNARDLKEVNLLSYALIKGTLILCSKMKAHEGYAIEKRKFIEELSKEFKSNLNHIRGLIDTWINALTTNGYYIKVCEIEATSRIIVGTNAVFGMIPFEIGLSLDPILNVPFIPGSSLKGAFRNALEDLIEREYKRKFDTNDVIRKTKEIVNKIFGSHEESSLVGVTDAYPVSPNSDGRLLEPDVITPHYPGVKTEFDVEPKPILFLTVAPGVKFRFLIFFNKKIYDEETKRKNIGSRRIGIVRNNELGSRPMDDVLNYAIHYGDDLGSVLKRSGRTHVNIVPWVDKAVLHAFAKGIGAKTSLGYSRFRLILYKSAGRG